MKPRKTHSIPKFTSSTIRRLPVYRGTWLALNSTDIGERREGANTKLSQKVEKQTQ